jgi:hypothetical protein
MDEKRCFKCTHVLPLDTEHFYLHPETADGFLNKCKECAKEDVKKHYRQTLAEHHEYDRKRLARPVRKKQRRESQQRRRALHPERYKANQMVNNAIRDGRLIRQPCSKCGSTVRVEAHHHDYSKPLEVGWLCFTCHRGGAHQRLV